MRCKRTPRLVMAMTLGLLSGAPADVHADPALILHVEPATESSNPCEAAVSGYPSAQQWLARLLLEDCESCVLRQLLYMSATCIDGEVVSVTNRVEIAPVPETDRSLYMFRQLSRPTPPPYDGNPNDEILADVYDRVELQVLGSTKFKNSMQIVTSRRHFNEGEHFLVFPSEVQTSLGLLPVVGPNRRYPRIAEADSVRVAERVELRERLVSYNSSRTPDGVASSYDALGTIRGVVEEVERVNDELGRHDRVRLSVTENATGLELASEAVVAVARHGGHLLPDAGCQIPMSSVEVGDTIEVVVCSVIDEMLISCGGGWGIFRAEGPELVHGQFGMSR